MALPIPRHSRRRAAALLLLAVTACSRAHSQPGVETERQRMVWPAPPAPARIELVRVFSCASDLGIRRAWWRRLGDFISGGSEMHLVRPAGVAARGDDLAVADAGAGVVHLYDLAHHHHRAVAGCGDHAFREPVAVTFWNGRLYTADGATRRIDILDLAGNCSGGWTLPEGSRPAGLALDEQRGRLYVADPGAHRVLAFDADGAVVTQFGRRGSGPGEFNFPGWLALDRRGRIYVTDALNFRVQIFTPDGTPAGGFGHHGDGSGDFARPKGIGVDPDGHVYVVDALFDAVQIFDTGGQYLLGFGTRGTGAGQLWLPSGLTIVGDRIYVADSYNHRVQVFRYVGGRE